MKYVVIFGVVASAVLLFLLSRATGNSTVFAQNYTLLLVSNVVVAIGLLLLVVYQMNALRRKLKAKAFGAKMTLRLLTIFALMAVLPGILIYSVSVRFLTRSIESWFDVRVENALDGGLRLGRTALDDLLRDLQKKAEFMAASLADQPTSTHTATLETLREQAGVQEAALFSSRGAIITFSASDRGAFLPEAPSGSILRQVRQQETFSAIDTIPDRGIYLRVAVPVNSLSLSEDIRVLQLLQPAPKRLAKDAEMVESVYRDYRELSFARDGLKKIFALTLTLTLTLALFSALSVAFLLSQRLSAPLGVLAAGTRAVARGDFTIMADPGAKDELGMLVDSFNSMTRQLAEARQVLQTKQNQLEAAKGYLEAVLAHLSSGVLALDGDFLLRTANFAALRILGIDLFAIEGKRPEQWAEPNTPLAQFAAAVVALFQSDERKLRQQQIEYNGPQGAQTLLIHGTLMLAAAEHGYIVVFDDVTRLIQAQRDAAWGEVARRLAHEIKNPLTPIQLSAERLEHKLSPKLDSGSAEMLRRSTQTIIDQVAALKNMVNAFSDYARSPEVHIEALDINRFITDIVTLYEPSQIPVILHLAPDLPDALGDATLLRQVIHNLLLNAQQAIGDAANPRVDVETHAAGPWVEIAVRDNGPGFPEQLLARAFEPYVTTKPKGTGLGLAIVKKIIEEHQGMLRIENCSGGGACVHISLLRAETA